MLSLPPVTSDAVITRAPAAEIAIAAQIRMIAISNTTCRLVIGPLADYFSPVATYSSKGVFGFARKHHASRVLYLTAGAAILGLSSLWTEIGVRSQSAVWVLSMGVGIVNGGVFNILYVIFRFIHAHCKLT